MNKILKTFVFGILAGIAIAIGGWLYIQSREQTGLKVFSAILFSIGLILICNFNFFLFTGKVCYLPCEIKNKNGLNYLVMLIVGIIGNYIGCLIMGLTIKNVCIVPSFVNNLVENKLNQSCYQLIILGILCNILIYFAVEGFKSIPSSIGKYLVLILCVSGFIVCGFEHCVADMFYFCVAGVFSFKSFTTLLLIILGNSIGGILIPLIKEVLHD